MVGQIHHLGEKYKEWVHLPVNKKMRIFGNPILERFTITPWYMVLIWIPINIGLFVHGTRRYIELTQGRMKSVYILNFLAFFSDGPTSTNPVADFIGNIVLDVVRVFST